MVRIPVCWHGHFKRSTQGWSGVHWPLDVINADVTPDVVVGRMLMKRVR